MRSGQIRSDQRHDDWSVRGLDPRSPSSQRAPQCDGVRCVSETARHGSPATIFPRFRQPIIVHCRWDCNAQNDLWREQGRWHYTILWKRLGTDPVAMGVPFDGAGVVSSVWSASSWRQSHPHPLHHGQRLWTKQCVREKTRGVHDGTVSAKE